MSPHVCACVGPCPCAVSTHGVLCRGEAYTRFSSSPAVGVIAPVSRLLGSRGLSASSDYGSAAELDETQAECNQVREGEV